MTKKIPLAIDAKPFANTIDKSVRRTMTKKTMTHKFMTNKVMTKAHPYFAEGVLVGVAFVVAWAMLVMIFCL